MNFICFGLEGPLSSQNNALELMKLFPNGDKIFEVISRYDNILMLEERENYEPGDKLALIALFLILHNISENDIARLASEATITSGAAELISWLQSSGWKVFCITTTYEQYAIHITNKLGIYAHNVAFTPFPLNKLRSELSESDRKTLHDAENEFLSLNSLSDQQLKQTLDRFYSEKLQGLSIGEAIKAVKPVGGRRKVAALRGFADKYAQPVSKWVVVGDSITDSRILQTVDKAGGLAIAFNGNQYALPYATMSLASTFISNLKDVLQIYQRGQRNAFEKEVKIKEKAGGSGDRGYFHWLSGRKNIDDVIEIHKRIRQLSREDAGKPG